MTLDQQIQLWNAIGTWVAGLATVVAVVVSLWFATRRDRVKLNVVAGVRLVIAGDGSPPREFVSISATNLGERPVTISIIGWRIGTGKKRKFCVQTLGDRESHDYPKRLDHGEAANFLVFTGRGWPNEFINKFIQSNDERLLRTLVAQVHTSVGQTADCQPEGNLLDLLKQHYDPAMVALHKRADAETH
jgi:hypothetical protein